MTRSEVAEVLNQIIQQAVMQSGGNWKRSYRAYVEEMFSVMGKLAPEVKPKPELPKYDEKLVRRVGTILQRIKFDADDHAAARRLIAELGLE